MFDFEFPEEIQNTTSLREESLQQQGWAGAFAVFAEGKGFFSFSSGKGQTIRSILLILSEEGLLGSHLDL